MKPSISAVLEHYGGSTADVSGWRNMRCPFHDDKHASASVNLEYEEFYCHACSVHGDAIGVVMTAEAVDYSEAVKRVEEITGQAPDIASASNAERSVRRSLLPAWTRGRRPRRKVFA